MMLLRLPGALLLTLALGGCAEPPYTNVDNAGLKTLLAQGVPVYDIRRAEEWRATGVVEGSRKLTYVDARGDRTRNSCHDLSSRWATMTQSS